MVYVKIENDYGGVFAKENFLLGELVYDLTRSKTVKTPTRTSIQVGEESHIEDEVGQYINHSCSPTCEITNYGVRALRDIKVNDEITFNYNSSEDTLANPFECSCCGKMITGRKNE